MFCDDLGRIRVQVQGLDPADHAHSKGVGTNGNAGDSAPVRVLWGLAGPSFGESLLPRVGMEVLLGCIGGDPDRLVVLGVLANGTNIPAKFSHTGSLPANRFVSGIKTKEIKGSRYWTAGSGQSEAQPAALPAGEPALMAFGAQGGSVNVTPKTHVTYAWENIDQVAQQHLQFMSGQRLNATAGKGMQLFARGAGIQAVAGEGPMRLQAQTDALTATAQKGVTISTNENEVLVSAPTIRLVAEDGSFIKIGGGVTLGTNGDIRLLSASHQWGEPSTEQATKTDFNHMPTDQRFKLHYPGEPGAGGASELPVAANKKFRVMLDDGRVIEGKSDANGLTDLIKDDAMRIAKIEYLKPKL